MTYRVRHIAIISICLFGLAACKSVYYNTFYNAEKHYRMADQKRKEAEIPGSRLTPAVYQQIYKAAIAKASAVLELYPNSKWVDDSLLLIGKAFYWREEYTDALTKFQELQGNFPDSEHIPEAYYWQGLSLWALERNNQARVSFGLINGETHPDLFGLAQLALAEMEASDGNYEDAVEAYRILLKLLGKKHKLRARAWQGVGNNLLQLARYAEALEAYRHVLELKPDTQINFETRLHIGTTLERQGKFDEALEAYERILKIKRLRIYEAEALLRKANVFRLKKTPETAEEIYEGIAKKYPRSRYSAGAYYQMGLIAQYDYRDLEKAKELFEKAARENRGSEPGQLALQRQKDLVSLERYRKQAASEDPKKALVPLFNLAELYLFRMGQTDSALATYQRALALSDDTEFKPKALYAIGLIYADSLKNETEARKSFQTLIDTYPNTPHARAAQRRIALTRTDDALAEARYLEAEALWQEGAPPQDYLPIFQQIADEYPNSGYAPKALYTLAWTYENDPAQFDRAKPVYERISTTYPLTRFGKIAKEKLEGDFLKPPEPVSEPGAESSAEPSTPPPTQTDVPAPTSIDSSETTEPQPLDAEDLDEPPELIESTPPVYPPSQQGAGRPATVVVRLLIATDGSVKKADVVSGPKPFHSAAVLAAVKYRFKPGTLAKKPRETWLELPIVFEPSE